VNATTGPTTVYYNCYCAAGDGMVFSFPTERSIVNSRTYDVSGTYAGGTPIAQAGGGVSYHLDEIFGGEFPPLVPAEGSTIGRITYSDTVEDVYSYLHRHMTNTSDYQLQCSLGIGTWVQIIDEGVNDSAYNFFQTWFCYRKGSKIYKAVMGAQSAAVIPQGIVYAVNSDKIWASGGSWQNPGVGWNNMFGRDGTVMQDFRYKPSLEVKLPWYHELAFVCNDYTRVRTDENLEQYLAMKYETLTNASGNMYVRLFMAIGDDFSFGWPCGAPILWYQ